MANDVKIRVGAQDQATPQFAKIRAEAKLAGEGISTHFTGATSALSKFEGGLKGVGGALGHARSQITGLVGSLGLLAGGAGLAGLVGVVGKSVTSARDFASSMELIRTQAGGTQAEVDKMSAAILAMSHSVGTGPDELAAGIYHIESAGIRGAKALDVLRIAAEGAKVGNADLESVTNALIAEVNSGIKGVGGMSGAMGTLNAIVGSGNMRMADLTEAFGTGILSTAKVFGVSIQSVGGALADMTNQGIPAVDAANSIRAAIRLMGAPTAAAAKALATVGLSSTSLAKDLRSPGGILTAVTDLKAHMDKAGLSATEQAALLTKAFGGKQSQGVLTLISNVDKLKSATDGVTKGAKGFDAAWAATQASAAEKWDKFSAAVSTEAIKIGDKLLPGITDGLTGVGDWIDAHGDEIAKVFGDGAKAMGELGGQVEKVVIPAVKNIAGAWNSMPADVKTLLIGGFIANKAVKWTFGIDVAGSVEKAVGGAILGQIGSLFSKSTTAAMSVQAGVVNVAGGVGGGLPGAVGGAAEGAGALGAGEVVAGGASIGLGGAAVLAAAAIGVAAATKWWAESQPGYRSDAEQGFTQTGYGKTALPGYMINPQTGGFTKQTPVFEGDLDKNLRENTAVLSEIRNIIPKGPSDRNLPSNAAVVGAVRAAGLLPGAKEGDRDKGLATVKAVLGVAKAVGHVREAIKAAAKDAPDKTWARKDLAQATSILNSGKTTSQQITALKKIQADFTAHGDTKTAAHIGSAVKDLQAIASAKLTTVNASVNDVTTAVKGLPSAMDAAIGTAAYQAYRSGERDAVGPKNAVGLLGITSGPTQIGVAGEAAGEAVAILRNPRPISGTSGGGGGDFHFHYHADGTSGVSGGAPMSPGAARELGQLIAPIVTRWQQRNRVLPRLGTGQSG